MDLCVLWTFVICFSGVFCLPHASFQRRDKWKRVLKNPQEQDSYFNEFKEKRSGGNEDSRNYRGELFSDDFFGVQADDSVRLMDYDRTAPIGRAEHFVDPFSDMIEEKDVQQFAYKQDQKHEESNDATLQEQTSPQNQGDSQKRVNEQKQILENVLKDHRKQEMENIKDSLRATEKDTETQQAKARIMAYTAKHKDDKKEAKNNSNPFSYLTLPETQSVYITPSKQKNQKNQENESKENNNMKLVKENFNQKQKENPKSVEPSSKLKKEESKTPDSPVNTQQFASSANVTISTPLEDTPPNPDNAEVVPTEVVEVKEAPDGESSGLETEIKNEADEMSSIVSSIMPTTSSDSTNTKTSNNTNNVDPKEDQPTPTPPLPPGADSLHRLDQASPNQDPEPPPKPNKIINIKAPDLNVSISFNSTENQAKYVQRLENVIKMVKGMEEPEPQALPPVVKPLPTKLPEETQDKTKPPSNSNSEQKNSITNETTNALISQTDGNGNTKKDDSAKKDDYQYVLHDGNLFKVLRVLPETENLFKEPSDKLATLDDQLSRLVKDAASKINVQKEVSTSLYPAPKILRNTTSNKANDEENKSEKQGKKQVDVNITSFPLKTDRMKNKKKKKVTKKKQGTDGRLVVDHFEFSGDGSNEDRNEDERKEMKKAKKHEKSRFHSKEDQEKEDGNKMEVEESDNKMKHFKLKKKHNKKHTEEDEDEDGLKHLEFHDDDEQESERVPKPKSKKIKRMGRKKNKGKKEFSDDEEDDKEVEEVEEEMKPKRKKRKKKKQVLHKIKKFKDNNDEDSEDENSNDEDEDENPDMSIHMLEKAKGVENDDTDSSLGNTAENSGNQMQHQEENFGINEEAVANVIKSKQRSKKLFGASLTKKLSAKLNDAGGKKGDTRFYVTQDGQRYQVNMKAIQPPVNSEPSFVGQDLLKKKFTKPMSSLVELPAVGSSPGYTIKLFTDPQKHSKTYEIKHGDKTFTVVENNHDDPREDDADVGVVRSLHPNPPAPSASGYNDLVSEPTRTTVIQQIQPDVSQMTSTTLEKEPASQNTIQVKEAVPAVTSVQMQYAVPKFVEAPISRKRVEASKKQPTTEATQQLPENPSLTIQSTVHKETFMNGEPQHIISSFVKEDFQPIQQSSLPDTLQPSSFTKAYVQQAMSDNLPSTSENFQPLSSPKVSDDKDKISTFSAIVKSSMKDIPTEPKESAENKDDMTASIIPSTLKSLEKLKTILPAFMGTRKTEFPSASENKFLSANKVIKSNENSLSQEIKGVTSLSSIKPISNEDFNRTLNADIVLK